MRRAVSASGAGNAPDHAATAETAADTAADKLLRLLLAFDASGDATLSDLARDAGLPKSTTHRLLATLQRHDLVERAGQSRYRLGFRAWLLGQRARPYQSLAHAAQPHLDALAASSGESAFLTVSEQVYAVCVASADSPSLMRLSLRLGSLTPMHLGASNRILMALLPPTDRALVARHWVQDGADRAALEDDLRSIRSAGYVVTSSQLTSGATAIAVPVFDEKGALIAGLSIGGPTDRFDETVAHGHLAALRDHADGISHDVAASLRLATPS